MGLESSTYPNGLNANWPLGTDPKAQGDDHLRLIKKVVKAVFPTGWDDASLPVMLQRYNYDNAPGVAEFKLGANSDISATKTKLGETATFVATYFKCHAILTARAGVTDVPISSYQSLNIYARLWNVTDAIVGEEIFDVGRHDNYAGGIVTRPNAIKIAMAYNFALTTGKSYKFEIFGQKGQTSSLLPVDNVQFLAHCLA